MGPDKPGTQSGYYLTGQVVAAYIQGRPPAGSPTRRRGKKSLLIRRDATLRISGALRLGIFEEPEKQRLFQQPLRARAFFLILKI
ncbi:MAG: hypothetical protein A2157_07665 [Deltaproteobacteria bacterium RBG_16_47_11]|nr:MAG: hypothetical protein A2157_07665 [Deltaproteobacteria bacterium RBG_16_47_11]